MKSIRKRITVCLIAMVLLSLVVVGAASMALGYRNALTTVNTMMRETAVLAADRIEQELTAYKNVAMDTGLIPDLSNDEVPLEDKRALIDERVQMHNFQRGNIVGADGISIFDGNDYSDRVYVQEAMQGNVYVSEPLISKVTGELSIMVAAPIYADGKQGGNIVGVVYFVPPETFLNDIVSSIQIGDGSRAYMINQSGDTIADVTLETITTQNIEREAESDPSLESRAKLHAAMRQGENGFGSIQAEDGPRFLAYAPVGGTDGWSLAVASPKKNFLAETYFGMFINIIVSVAAAIVAIIVALRLSKSISVPMQACAERMKLLVQGDLDAPVPQAKGKDETAELTRSTAEMVTALNTIIDDIGYLLNEMANKNFDVKSAHPEAYVGSFQSILGAMRNLKVGLSGTMRQIEASASQVSDASGQVATGAQSLSKGCLEQASAVEELASTISGISATAESTSAVAKDAGNAVSQAGEQLSISVEHVQNLNTAMEKISGSSEQISKIIATIENIAFQTNLLALNAAVEAARAGSSGKGFAVVADEVRNLATKSDQAAKATKNLIQGSIAAVEEGTSAANQVTDSLRKTSEIASNVTSQMNTVVHAVEKQTEAIAQVTEGIDQISDVVQTNSATAQESAAASEELSAEAASLKQMVDQFTLADPETSEEYRH